MMIKHQIAVLIVIALITACGSQSDPINEPDILDTPTETQENNVPIVGTSPPVETTAADCLGDQVSPIGQSIADEYESADYEQVMTWFCNGAEFEDILVALETESQTDTSADEMLKMLSEGFTWDDIWHLVGLTD
ncbi:MAG TPA: hypothetical protein VIS72_11555 [Anaerolineales bacterium]